MSRITAVFVLGGLSLFLTPLTASAQFPRPFGIPGAPAFQVPFAPPIVAPLPVYSVLPYTVTRAFPNYVLFRQQFPYASGGGFSQSAPYLYSQSSVGATATATLTMGGASGRENALLMEQHNLEQAQRAATQAASIAPAGTIRNAAAGGVLDSGAPAGGLNPALAPADAKAIASGVALNKLLKEIVLAESKGAKGPSPYVPPLLIKDVRFAGSPSADLLNLARQDALAPPSAFDAPALAASRAELLKEFATVAEAMRSGKAIEPASVGQLNATFLKFEEASAPVLKGAPAADAQAAQEFLTTFAGALKVLKDGGAKDVLNPTWATEGLTGSDLVKHMVKHKLEFAPAPAGAGESYETLNKQLSTYLFVLTKKK